MASLSEQKYTTLRKRLDQFGFKQPLAIESLPLVEKLFQAFIQTTEELKKAKEVPDRNSGNEIRSFFLLFRIQSQQYKLLLHLQPMAIPLRHSHPLIHIKMTMLDW